MGEAEADWVAGVVLGGADSAAAQAAGGPAAAAAVVVVVVVGSARVVAEILAVAVPQAIGDDHVEQIQTHFETPLA